MKSIRLLLISTCALALASCAGSDYSLTGSINATIPVEGMSEPVHVGIGISRPARMSGKSAKKVQPVQP